MDTKVEGIDVNIFSEALARAKVGRQQILSQMKKCHPATRNELSPYAPHIKRINVISYIMLFYLNKLTFFI